MEHKIMFSQREVVPTCWATAHGATNHWDSVKAPQTIDRLRLTDTKH